jgi:hypothetical protein
VREGGGTGSSGAAAVVASAALHPRCSARVPLHGLPPVCDHSAPRGAARNPHRAGSAAPAGPFTAARAPERGCPRSRLAGGTTTRAGSPESVREGGLSKCFATVIFALPFHPLSPRRISAGGVVVRGRLAWPPRTARAGRKRRPRTPEPARGRRAGDANRVVTSPSFADVSQGIQAQLNVWRSPGLAASTNDAGPEPRRALWPPQPVSPAPRPATGRPVGGRSVA